MGMTSSLTDEGLVSLVEKLTDDRFLGFVDDFVEENSQYFVTSDEEQRHYYHEIHLKYQRFFEARVEAWLRERGESPEAFAVTALQGGLAQDVAEELLAVSDYQAFVQMMQARRADLMEKALKSRGCKPVVAADDANLGSAFVATTTMEVDIAVPPGVVEGQLLTIEH